MTTLLESLRPCDTLNTVYHWDGHIGRAIVCRSIQGFQYITPPNGFWKSTHTRIFFSPDKIYEVTFPKSQFTTLEAIQGEELRLNRHATHRFLPEHIDYMLGLAKDLEGEEYDVPELLNHLLSLVYPKFALSSADSLLSRHFVCSSGVRVLFESLRKKMLEPQGIDSMKRLFTYDGKDTLIERTKPEHFDYPYDFTYHGTFKNGVKV